MSYLYFIILGFTVLIAAIIAGIRFKEIDSSFYPFILCIWLASLNETVSLLLAENGYSNIPNNNIYSLAEALLITWQAKKWNLMPRNNYLFLFIQLSYVTIWLYEIRNIAALQQLHFYFRVYYAVLIVIMSINMTNRLMLSHGKALLKNPLFLICTGYIIYFTFKILIDATWLYKIKGSSTFLYDLYIIMALINGMVNGLFAIAVLWIPRKPRYISL